MDEEKSNNTAPDDPDFHFIFSYLRMKIIIMTVSYRLVTSNTLDFFTLR